MACGVAGGQAPVGGRSRASHHGHATRSDNLDALLGERDARARAGTVRRLRESRVWSPSD
jgi:hypothetical protein